MLPKKILIISGLSGSGKSSVLHQLEDQGFFAVDNLPIGMLPDLAKVIADHPQAIEHGVSVVIDARSSSPSDDVKGVIDGLKSQGVDIRLLYLEASRDVLLKRYSFTRRRHPLGYDSTVLEGIERELMQLQPYRVHADYIIDTSDLAIAELRSRILSILARSASELQISVSSFGFKYGIMLDADFVFDVRFLKNPYYIDALKYLSGVDAPVQEYIMNDERTPVLLGQLLELFQTIIPTYHLSGKNYMQIAVGCTGGRHRSVFVAEWLGARLSKIEGVKCRIRHRDLSRNMAGKGA